MPLSNSQRNELLSMNDGVPFIITEHSRDNDLETFSVILYVRTVASPGPVYTESVHFILSFSSDYPDVPPVLKLKEGRIFHPDFTDDGIWTDDLFDRDESIGEYLRRLVRTLEYRESDIAKTANRNAVAWYNSMKDTGLFPIDQDNSRQSPPRITILKTNKRITIYRTNRRENFGE